MLDQVLIAIWLEGAYQAALILHYAFNPSASIVARPAFLYGYDRS